MHQLPSHLHEIARFHERRDQLERQNELALLVGRILTTVRRADIAMAVTAGYHDRADLAQPSQPTMAWFDGPREQPRDGRGRFLSKAWLAGAELFLPADRAWFRRPVSTEGK